MCAQLLFNIFFSIYFITKFNFITNLFLHFRIKVIQFGNFIIMLYKKDIKKILCIKNVLIDIFLPKEYIYNTRRNGLHKLEFVPYSTPILE